MAAAELSREETIAEAQRLRDEGLKLREIADVMGLAGPRSAWRFVNPERDRAQNLARNEKKRQWEQKQPRGNCEDCGDELGIASLPRGHRFCQVCFRVREAERVDTRARQIVLWWAYGWSLQEIADDLGWTRGHLAKEFDTLREKGYDLPYRYSRGKRNASKFPDQVAA